MMVNYNLLGGFPKNDGVSSSVGMMKFPTEWNKKHVPNHQPENYCGE